MAHSPFRARRVLIVGIDGLGSAFLERDLTEMPHFTSLLSEGTATLRARTVFPSVSAPAWCAVLCSQAPPESGILGNEWTPESRWTDPPAPEPVGRPEGVREALLPLEPGSEGGEFNAMPPSNGRGKVPETMWAVAKDAFAARGETCRTAAVLGWDWIHHLCADCDVLIRDKDDEEAAEAMAQLIRSHEPPDLMFLHLDEVDHAGHDHGWGSAQYFAAMHDADRRLGLLLEALRSAGLEEDTFVVVIADHGGVEQDHGGFTQVELFVPFVARGPGVLRGRRLAEDVVSVSLLDVAPTALASLGVRPGRWMRGRVVEECF